MPRRFPDGPIVARLKRNELIATPGNLGPGPRARAIHQRTSDSHELTRLVNISLTHANSAANSAGPINHRSSRISSRPPTPARSDSRPSSSPQSPGLRLRLSSREPSSENPGVGNRQSAIGESGIGESGNRGISAPGGLLTFHRGLLAETLW
jgi:hypothetical protein